VLKLKLLGGEMKERTENAGAINEQQKRFRGKKRLLKRQIRMKFSIFMVEK
jgi:hypothetical protein